MDTPFNLEGEYFKGRNKVEDKEEAEDLTENTNAEALLSSVDDKLNNPEIYLEDDLVTSYRKDLYELLDARLETVNDLSELQPQHQTSVKEWVRGILSGDDNSIFHTENKFDKGNSDSLESKMGTDPYDSLIPIAEDLRVRFEQNFWKEIDLLDLIPRGVFLTFDSEVQSVDFDLIIRKDNMSKKFNDIFPNSDYFYIVYDRSERMRPFDHFYLSGVTPSGEFEEGVELDDFGSSSF